MPPTHRVRLPLRRVRDDAGFSLVEAMVALTLLGMVSAVTLTAVVGSTAVSKNSSSRLVATGLAQQDLQAMQSLRYPYYPTADTACGVVVDGITYTVTRTVSQGPITSTAAPTTTAPATPATPATPTAATPSATTSATTATPSPTTSATTSPTATTSGTASGTPSATATTPTFTVAPRSNNPVPSSSCARSTASATSTTSTSTSTSTATGTAAPGATPTTLPPCPAVPDFDKRQYMIVTTKVSWRAQGTSSISLRALIAC